jgi:hypothetical protein
MKVELDKEDLVNLVSGISPSYIQIIKPEFKKLGEYNGSYDRWSWYDYALQELSEKELYSLYTRCKKAQ